MTTNNFAGEMTIAAGQSKKEKTYWLNKLSGDLLKSSFSSDYKNVPGQRQMETVKFDFPVEISARLAWMINKSDIRLYIILLTELYILLNKYSGHEDIIIGSPIYKQEVEGHFINTVLTLRTRLEGHVTFKDLLFQVKKTLDEASEHQNYPLKTLLNDLNLTGTDDEFPLFDTAVLLENIHSEKYIEHIPLNITFSFQRVDDTVNGTITYNSYLYKPETIARITGHLNHLMAQTLFNADIRLSEIDILPEAEKRRILVDFNDTAMEYPHEKTISELFTEKAEQFPDHVVVIYKDKHISYRELHERTGCLAEQLLSKGVQANTIVGIMMERSAEMVIGILGILKAGGAYLPIDPGFPQERIDYMLKDSNAKLTINYEFLKEVPQAPLQHSAFSTQHSNLSYVIYTSGTTGKPKGVMIEHKNVINFIYGLHQTVFAKYSGPLNFALVSSFLFDASVQLTYGALLLGHRLYIVPEQQRGDGAGLLDFYTQYVIDISDGTPTHMNMLANSVKGRIITLAMKHFIIGGDRLLAPVVKEFLDSFAANPPWVTNVYGPTECTVNATSFEVSPGHIASLTGIPIGKPIPNYHIDILDKMHHLTPIGVPGEIYISGEGVARGYLNRPELTHEKFDQDLWDVYDDQDKKKNEDYQKFFRGSRGAILQKSPPCCHRYYKTGDLARWLPDGNIEFLGRVDHQVKLRGYRIELEEIEKHLLQHKAIKTIFVTIRDNENDQTGDKSLCAYFTADTKLTQAELKNYLAQNLPAYMIPTYLVQIEKMPLTASGKIDRKALPAPGLKAGDEYTAPRDALEKKLARIWADVLATSEEIIGIDTDFFENGGHSLSANYLALKIQKELNVKFSLMDVFTYSTLKSQAGYINEYIKKSTEKQFFAIEVLEKKSYYELSSAQRRLHILQQIEPGSIAYNIKAVFILAGELDKKKLAGTFRQIIDRHESLRTSFEPVNNKFIQKIHETVDFNIIEYHAAECEAEPLIKAFIKPFNLGEAPLIRACTIQIEENKHILVIDMHHIITDGISMGVLEREFKTLYAGRELPPLRLQYKDYSEWQKKLPASEKIKKQQEYWLEVCQGEIPRVDIPLDFPRPEMQSFAGNSIELQLEAELTKNLDNFAAKTGVTHYMLFLAVLNILLAKYSGQDDIIVGTPTSGRNHADLESIIGCFVNVLVMRNFPRPDMLFTDFLQDVKQHALLAFENQDFTFDELVELLNIKRDRSRNPVYDVVFALDEAAAPGEVLTGIQMQPYPYERGASKTDLRLGVTVQPGAITLLLTYATSLFERATADRLLDHYNEILAQVIANPNIQLKNIEIYHSRVDLKSNPRRQEHDDFGF